MTRKISLSRLTKIYGTYHGICGKYVRYTNVNRYTNVTIQITMCRGGRAANRTTAAGCAATDSDASTRANERRERRERCQPDRAGGANVANEANERCVRASASVAAHPAAVVRFCCPAAPAHGYFPRCLSLSFLPTCYYFPVVC